MPKKSTNLLIRVEPSTKTRLQFAAKRAGQSMSVFVLQAALKEAKSTEGRRLIADKGVIEIKGGTNWVQCVDCAQLWAVPRKTRGWWHCPDGCNRKEK